MTHNRSEWLDRIRMVELEHAAMRMAVDRLLIVARSDPTGFRGEVTPEIIKKASERLDSTYLIRLFAEFERGLRL